MSAASGAAGPPAARGPGRLAATLLLALAAGALAQHLRMPLPWMLGPLLATAAASTAGVRLQASQRLRNVGQGLIGVALGLYFTPAVLAMLLQMAPAITLAVVWALAMGYAFFRFLRWSQRGEVDTATAFYSAAIGGASEMAVLAERAGARVDRVAAAHSLRVLLVVVIVPFAFSALDLHGRDLAGPAHRAVVWPHLVPLLAACAFGGWALRRWQVPNPWVLGALAVAGTHTALALPATALPRELANAAQLAIAVSLGTRFTPEFLRAAPQWLGAVAAGTLTMLAASAGFGTLLALALGRAPATLVLATTPGGIAEVAITASVLGLGAPVVTAFQVMRYIAVLLGIGPLYRWVSRHRALQPRQ